MRGEDSGGGETEKLEELQHREKTTRMSTLGDDISGVDASSELEAGGEATIVTPEGPSDPSQIKPWSEDRQWIFQPGAVTTPTREAGSQPVEKRGSWSRPFRTWTLRSSTLSG